MSNTSYGSAAMASAQGGVAVANLNPWFVRFLGIAGAFGGILCFIGDMLYYYVDGSTNLAENIGVVNFDRIIWSCLLSYPTCWLYLAGCVQVFLAFQPASKAAQAAIGIGMLMITSGWAMVHANYVTYAIGARLARDHNLSLPDSISGADACQNAMRNCLYAVFAVVSLVFIPLVLARRTHYPRWMCLAYPLLPFLLEGVVSRASLAINANVGLVISGGYLNIMMFAFFSFSTLALWNAKISSAIALPAGQKEEEEIQLP